LKGCGRCDICDHEDDCDYSDWYDEVEDQEQPGLHVVLQIQKLVFKISGMWQRVAGEAVRRLQCCITLKDGRGG
jgi:hypothetical protein